LGGRCGRERRQGRAGSFNCRLAGVVGGHGGRDDLQDQPILGLMSGCPHGLASRCGNRHETAHRRIYPNSAGSTSCSAI
jgi:hypothetical protein